jgi:small subunit ribosomal protein S9
MNHSKIFYTGLGKRKTSIAKVFLTEGSGIITVNKKSLADYLSGSIEEGELIKTPLILLNLTNSFDISIIVHGGGISGQLEAMRLAISKALCTINSQEYRPTLNQNFLLRRDSRIKETRKYGLKKARKASQYSKR